ncbi:MAG: cupin domain-containing protein [Stappiaceae bacterium]
MKTPFDTFRNVALAAVFAATTGLASAASTVQSEEPVKLLTARFAPRQVVQVEVGDFRFKPGQIAPVHTHDAPAIGYVSKGMIIYQVEGGKPQILRAGDAFYEPTGVRILRFDNASATEEAIFFDFNLEQVNEPFIVFEEDPKVPIDRRTLPTTKLDGRSIDQAEVFSTKVAPDGSFDLVSEEPIFGLVAEGVVEVRIDGKASTRIAVGGTFALPTYGHQATITNTSGEVPANVITFQLN